MESQALINCDKTNMDKVAKKRSVKFTDAFIKKKNKYFETHESNAKE
jgi:hypothetical protein